jgi:hypothetical protein
MAYTQTQLDALKAALASGELRVTFEGRSVEYRSIDDLQKAIAAVSAEVTATTSGAAPRVRLVRIATSSGF